MPVIMKYRAWDTYCKRWRDEFDWIVNPETGKPHWIHDGEFYQDEAAQLILCRSAGVFDINGKEIYEGDFLGGEISNVFLDGSPVANSLHVVCPKQVIWMGDKWGYSEKHNHLSYITKTSGLVIPAKYFSVIGNVFENHDLITTPI